MKLGCAVWTFCEDKYNPPYEPGIEIIGKLGFEGVELILYSNEHLESYYTRERVGSIRKLLRSLRLSVSELAIYGEVVEGLSAVETEIKERAIARFRKAAVLAQELGAPIVNTVATWPYGLRAPIAYPPAYIHPSVAGAAFEPKLKMDLPESFDWDQTWGVYVDSIKTCSEIAAMNGLKFALEGHANVMVSSTDAFLRLYDHVQSSSLGMNFDTGWQFLQREYLPLSIYKLKNKLLHTHLRDGDGLYCYILPPGLGVIHWESVMAALSDISYSGYLSIEIPLVRTPAITAKYVGDAQRYLQQSMRSAT